MRDLSVREEMWIAAYFGDACFNASEASRLSGCHPGHAARDGSRMLSNPVVKARLREVMAEHGCTVEEVFTRLSNLARSSLEDFVTFDQHEPSVWHVDVAKGKARGRMQNLETLRRTKTGLEIKVRDPLPALQALARIHHLIQDKSAITVNIDNRQQTVNLSPEARQARILEIVENAQKRLEGRTDAINADFKFEVKDDHDTEANP